MVAFFDWFPAACVGSLFTLFGLLKVYGLANGIQGGGCKPLGQKVCGSCPSWSRGLNISVTLLFLAIGLANLAWLVWILRAKISS
jgi:hypothetical protein